MGKFAQRLGQKVKSGARTALKVGAVVAGGVLAYKEATEGGMIGDAIGAVKMGGQEASSVAEQAREAEENIKKAGKGGGIGGAIRQAGAVVEEGRKAKNKAEELRLKGVVAQELAGTGLVQQMAEGEAKQRQAVKVGEIKAKHTYASNRQQMGVDRANCQQHAGKKNRAGKAKYKACKKEFKEKYGESL